MTCNAESDAHASLLTLPPSLLTSILDLVVSGSNSGALVRVALVCKALAQSVFAADVVWERACVKQGYARCPCTSCKRVQHECTGSACLLSKPCNRSLSCHWASDDSPQPGDKRMLPEAGTSAECWSHYYCARMRTRWKVRYVKLLVP